MKGPLPKCPLQIWMYYAQKRTKDSDANIQCYKTTSMSILLEFLFEHNIQVIIIQIKGR
jgi:hypothetical protein